MPIQALNLYSLFNHSTANSSQFADHHTYFLALKACADAASLGLGKSIHCRVIRTSPRLPKNPDLNNSLPNIYAAALDDVAQLVFDRMPKRNVVAWNIMIGHYVRKERFWDVGMFRRMVEVGIRPTGVSFINVFPAVARIGNKKLGRFVHGMIVKFGSGVADDVFVVSSAIFMYAELGEILLA